MDSNLYVISQEQKFFLQILRNILHEEKITMKEEVVLRQIKGLFRLSSIHMVSPLMIDALYHSYPSLMEKYKQGAVKQVIKQASKTSSFILLYQKMIKEGLTPIVLKGIICRNLYGNSEARRSVDEDLLICPDEIYKYNEFFIRHGFSTIEPDISLDEASEVSYKNKNNHLYLEIHKYLFSKQDIVYGEINKLFENRKENVVIPIYNTEIHTLEYTDHLLYMVCHAYKHLIYSGVGIRQICDMVLFAESYGKYINWEKIVSSLEQLQLSKFAEALLKIGVDYLGMDTEKAECSDIYSACNVDEKPLLYDILSGGIYGSQDENRLHSANMTLSAVSSRKQGKRKDGLWNSLFPSFSYMSSNYTYLYKNKYLLPFAWIHRIFMYLGNPNKKIQPGKSIEIGKQRIKILEKYKLL